VTVQPCYNTHGCFFMNDIELSSIVLTLGLLFDIGLGVLLYLLNPRRPANQLFALWLFGVAMWTVSILGYLNSGSADVALLWMRASYTTAIVAIVGFWYFATQFPNERPLSPKLHILNAAVIM